RALPFGPEMVVTRVGGDGRTVAAAYRTRDTPPGARQAPCRLALLDLAAGVVQASHALCGPDEDVLDLAVAGGGAGEPTGFAGLGRSEATRGAATPARAGGRIVALDRATGGTRGVAPLAEVAARLTVLPARPGQAARVLCVCGVPDAARLGRDGALE